MCRINCNGACPQCSAEDHKPSCVSQYMNNIAVCTCDGQEGVSNVPPAQLRRPDGYLGAIAA
jgi:hypothetical protein